MFDRMSGLFNRLSNKGEEVWAQMVAARAVRQGVNIAGDVGATARFQNHQIKLRRTMNPPQSLNLGPLGATLLGGAVLGGGLVEYLNTRKHGRPNDELYNAQ
ncbi:hypothetical protein [Neomoorella thermoacetica]|nr:hypothetical protein [Moorella thermoacetica]